MTIFMSPGNVAFSIFGLDVYFYGIIMGIAIVVGLFIADKTFKYLYGYKNIILDTAPFVLLGGVVGARIYYCVLNGNYYLKHLLEIFDIRGGGLSIHGAMLGGILVLFYISKKYTIKLSELSDGFATAFPLSQAIARWGNFFNSEAFGTSTNLPWGVYIPIENRPEKFINNSYFHPAFLYESILDLIIFLLMLHTIKKKKLSSGSYTAIYLILYSIARILVESLRIDSPIFIHGIAFPILVSILIIIGSIFYLFKKRI